MLIDERKRNQFLRIFQKDETKEFLYRFSIFLLAVLPCSGGNWLDIILKLALSILIYSSLLGPYITLVISIVTANYHITFISIISSIFFTISLIGSLGKGMCYCLYQPCNWFFLMLISDFITLAGDIIIFFIDTGQLGFNAPTIIYLGNTIFVILFLYRHCITYIKLNKIYQTIRELEMKVMLLCMTKYLNDSKLDASL
jgi:peptidoglycan/LPS O-acetylase OafA/YrhL